MSKHAVPLLKLLIVFGCCRSVHANIVWLEAPLGCSNPGGAVLSRSGQNLVSSYANSETTRVLVSKATSATAWQVTHMGDSGWYTVDVSDTAGSLNSVFPFPQTGFAVNCSPYFIAGTQFTSLPTGGNTPFGQVFGMSPSGSYVGGSVWANEEDTQSKPAIWHDGLLQVIQMPNHSGVVRSINNAGTALITSNPWPTVFPYTTDLYKWTPQSGLSEVVLPWSAEATKDARLTDSGELVGTGRDPNEGGSFLFRVSPDGQISTCEIDAEFDELVIGDVNAEGIAVGYVHTRGGADSTLRHGNHAFVFDGTNFNLLSELLGVSDDIWLTGASSISDRNLIAGLGSNGGGTQVFLASLSEVPEPTTSAVFLLFGEMLSRRRRERGMQLR
jgi:hypothetical protein